MTKCPVCRTSFGPSNFGVLAEHFLDESERNESAHVRWLNQSVSRQRLSGDELANRLEERFRLPPDGLGRWIRAQFIARFFGPRPHPFVVALQHPTPATLYGYAAEHQHFLGTWVRCCAYILARSGERDVVRYEIDNVRTEYGGDGPDRPSHYELLLRMGEATGVSREELLAIAPSPTTERTTGEWLEICASERWVAAMAAMHTLELIAHRGLTDQGATVHYFDPAILDDGTISPAARDFLREGYEADVGHAEEAIALVERFAPTIDVVEDVQAIVLRSIDLFDDYLLARLERAEAHGPTG